MGGAQPLAVTLNGGVCLVVDVDATPPAAPGGARATSTRSPPTSTTPSRVRSTRRPGGEALSIGVVGNCADVLPELLRRGVEVDVVTDQTRRTTRSRTCPTGVALEDWHDYAAAKPEEFTDRARASMARHVEAMVGFLDAGAEVFDYGNSIRDEARQGGFERAFAFPGFVPAYIRPLFCEGKGPFRWAALSGDPADIAVTDEAVLDLFPDNDHLHRWIRAAQEQVAFQGLPARICWLGYGERDRAGLRFNELVASGRGQRADRHRPRPPRLRLGRVALPRDRGDARRFRRDRRLAAAQRPHQHVVRGDLGLDPPRRRRRHRPLDPRRAGQSSPTARRWRRRSWSAC